MSDDKAPEATNQGDDIVTGGATLSTQLNDDQGVKGPQPIYKEDADESPVDAKEVESDDEVKDESGEKPEDKSDDGETKEYESLDRPEGSLLSDADMERIVARSKEQGLGKEAAQKQVEFADEILKENQERVNQAHGNLSEKWIKQCEADKEIGGEKFDNSVALASKAIKKFGTPEFIQSLNETKFGNNPEVVRIFARIGRAMSPDELIVSDSNVGGEKTYEELFYPSQN